MKSVALFKILSDVIPTVCFFVTWWIFGAEVASIVFATLLILTLILHKFLKIEASLIHIFLTVLAVILCVITAFTGDTSFVKMKPTIAYLMISGMMIYAYIKKRNIIKNVFPHNALSREIVYQKISYRSAWFFGIMAILNEIVWRLFSDKTWIYFKIFGASTLFIVFIFANIPLLQEHKGEKKGEE